MTKQKVVQVDYNPIDYYNHNHFRDAGLLLVAKNKSLIISDDDRMIVVNDSGKEVTQIRRLDGCFISEDGCSFMKADLLYSPFMILTKFQHKGNYLAAMAHVNHKYLSKDIDYMRVGVDYMKKILKTDRFGIQRTVLSRWKKEELVLDSGGKWILNQMPRYDGFTAEPSNINYQAVVDNHYNLYHHFSHEPKKGSWEWTERLLKHVFGQDKELFRLGLIYLQVLYLHPKQILPILVLASKTRATGKTTFVTWMAQLFGANMSVINPEDLKSQFNSSYAHSNVIAIEETTQDRASLVEKLKMLSTSEMISYNAKFVNAVNIPFFGHFIITTNDDDKFMRVDDNEIRFWVRELKLPKFKNTTITKDLTEEIPAFLYHLRTLPPVDFTRSRMVFTPEEINTQLLDHVKDESRSGLFKEMLEELEEFFNDWEKVDAVEFTPADLKRKFFREDNRYEINYIRRVLKNEFKMKPTTQALSYIPFAGTLGHYENKRAGRYYRFYRERFVQS